MEQRFSDNLSDHSHRDVPSFIEPRPPLILNPFMRPRPQEKRNLLELFEEDSEIDEPELVQVYLRLKPCNVPSNLYEVRSDKCLISSVDTAPAGHGRRTQHNVSKMYTFSHIFGPECNQKEIFDNVVKENLRRLADGHSFTLLTYGASGSGKTYTLMGTVASPGLVPRSLEYVFRVVEAAQSPAYKPSDGGAVKLNYAEQDFALKWVRKVRTVSAAQRDKFRRMSSQLCSDATLSSLDLSKRVKNYVWVSFVEIYNEGIYDLLVEGDRRASSTLRIREDAEGNVFVKGATQAFVRSGEEAYDVLVAGKHNLQIAATGVHARSSRSHCIFTITMLTETDAGVRIACVRLCDLAGCERARRTGNTGARMLESRAINSSLHVLERCLHMLRRRQRCAGASMVPYRESKLTRLLGAGLSGSRGEAVSMVVTLNPSPEYQHETKHVLQLAAVAKDIQVNHTMAELSSFDCTSHDTTALSSAEVMKLRADNERLHFELEQARARIKELSCVMEEKQQQAAATMRELVEEAKDMTRQYYEAQLRALRTEMEDMAEEYEMKLSARAPSAGTPSRLAQHKIAQLMTDNAILEEQLAAERLARARADDAAQHYIACIEERDDKASKEDISDEERDENSNSESEEESDEEEDPCNESLEPSFKKEDINRSRLLRQRLHQSIIDASENFHSANESDDSVLEKTTDTIKDESVKDTTINDKTLDGDDEISDCFSGDVSRLVNTVKSKPIRGTYCVKDECVLKNELNETNVLKDVSLIDNNEINVLQDDLPVLENNHTNIFKDEFPMLKNNKKSEHVKKAMNFEDIQDIPVFKHKAVKDIRATFSVTKSMVSLQNSPSLEEYAKNIGNDSLLNNDSGVDDKMVETTSDKIVNKINQSIKSNKNSKTSLARFEQLEAAANFGENDMKIKSPRKSDFFTNIKILKEKRNYFVDDVAPKVTDEPVIEENKIKNDNVDVKYNKAVEVVKELEYDMRSPSIVKDDETTIEPSTMRKLLGKSITGQAEVMSSIPNRLVQKKEGSIDIFEGLDSPIKPLIDNVRKSMEKIVIDEAKPKVNEIVIKQERVSEIKEFTVPVISINDEFKSPKALKKIDRPNKTDNAIKTDTNQTFLSESQFVSKENNTVEDFENIYKDITAPRVTEFDLLVAQDEVISSNKTIEVEEKENKAPNIEKEDVKYNLRKHTSTKTASENKDNFKVLLESQAKCESNTKSIKRSLRLRRRKNQSDDDDQSKAKEIVNLQEEFSDVTMNVPATSKKVFVDIPSPEKKSDDDENPQPIYGIQSCPSKSVTRSRRKLFTPRAEPLEESLGQAGDSTERIRVLRPSYHRPRARRKL